MEPTVGCKKNINTNNDIHGNGPHEIDRLRAMSDFRKNIKPGEYIDCDLYGRGDERVFCEMVSTEEKSSESQMEKVKAPRCDGSPKGPLVLVRFVGKGIRGFLGKLTSRIDCFGRCSTKASSTANDNELESADLVTIDPSPMSAAEQGKPFCNGLSINVDALTADEQAKPKPELRSIDEESVNEVKDDESPNNMMDSTPHRVQSKVDSGDDFSVVEKGTVVRTLMKLQSTGSFVFKQPSSFGSEKPKLIDEGAQADRSSLLDSKDSTTVIVERQLLSSRKSEHSQEGRLFPYEAPHPRSSEPTQVQELDDINYKSTEDGDAQIVAASDVIGGDVKKLRSLFEDDTTDVGGAVVANEMQTNGMKERSEKIPYHETASPLRPMNSVDLQDVVVEVKSGSSVEDTHTPLAVATNISSGSGEKLRSSFEKDSADVHEKILLGRVSSVLKITPLTVGPEFSSKYEQGASEVLQSKTAPGEGCEQAPPMSMQELSKHLSGHVGRVRSLFDSQSSEAVVGGKKEELSRSRTHIHSGLSCDSAVFDADGEHEMVESTDLEVQSKLMDTKVNERKPEIDAITQDNGKVMKSRGDDWHNDVDRAREIPELMTDAEVVTETAREGNGSSGAGAEVNSTSKSSSSSTASTEDLSHPISHLVGSCTVM